MLDQIIEFDRNLFLTLNGCHNGFFDVAMPFITHKYTGIPIYIGILMLIIYKWRGFSKEEIKTICIAIALVAATVALCDLLSNVLFKHTFQRLRPGWDPEIGDIARLLTGRGKKFGFISCHASNLFGLATATVLLIRKRWYAILIYLWAIAVSYSRIYVGKHFPADVVCGALFGLFIGWLIYYITVNICRRYRLCSI